MITNPKLVIDISSYQERLDASILKSSGVEAVIVKSGQGMERDPLFVSNGQAVVDGGLTLMAYYWDDIRFDPAVQAKWAIEDLQSTGLPIKFLWVDQEQWWSNWNEWLRARRHEILMSNVSRANPDNISLHNKTFMKTISGFYSPVGIYTSYGFTQSWAKPMHTWIKDYPLWLAHYGKQPATPQYDTWKNVIANWLPDYEPLVPLGGNRELVVGHQFSGDAFRLPGVYDSLGNTVPLDLNVFDETFLTSLVENPSPEKPPIGQTPPIPTEGAGEYMVNVCVLNIRSEARKDARIQGALRQNTQVKVIEITKDWAHLENGGWVYAPYLTPMAAQDA